MTKGWPRKGSGREDLPDGGNSMCKGWGKRTELQEVMHYGEWVSLDLLGSRSQEGIRHARDFLGEHSCGA